MHILNLFVDFAEVGQTRLSFLLFQDQKDLIQQVCPSMIERIIGRIVKNPRVRNNDGCEFNPELLEMLLCLLSIHGKIYKPNVEILYKCL